MSINYFSKKHCTSVLIYFKGSASMALKCLSWDAEFDSRYFHYDLKMGILLEFRFRIIWHCIPHFHFSSRDNITAHRGRPSIRSFKLKKTALGFRLRECSFPGLGFELCDISLINWRNVEHNEEWLKAYTHVLIN